jgi:hypothetical protein
MRTTFAKLFVIALFVIAAALALGGCATDGTSGIIYHSVPSEVTVTEPVVTNGVVAGRHFHQQKPKQGKQEVYETVVITSSLRFALLPQATLGSRSNQCRIAEWANRENGGWDTVLCFSRWDLDGSLSVKGGVFEYVGSYVDGTHREHIYQWRDLHHRYEVYPYWQYYPQWYTFPTNGETFEVH